MLLPLATVPGVTGVQLRARSGGLGDDVLPAPCQTATKIIRPFSLGLHLVLTRMDRCRTKEEARCSALSCLQRCLGKVEKPRFFRVDGPVNT